MDKKCWGSVLLLCVVVFLVLCLAAGPAHAQKGAKAALGGEKDIGTKSGFDVLKDAKNNSTAKSATKLQMCIGFGSIFVMIAVLKWL